MKRAAAVIHQRGGIAIVVIGGFATGCPLTTGNSDSSQLILVQSRSVSWQLSVVSSRFSVLSCRKIVIHNLELKLGTEN